MVIKGLDGTGEPVFTDGEIGFNGDSKNGLDHETFYFDLTSIPFDFEFCKTSRKPYDILVCICLLSLRENMYGFEFSSDGKSKEWKESISLYEEVIGELNKKNID